MARSRDDLDLPLHPARAPGRQAIGAFARAVGLSASALRQYGESGLLVPDHIDERTGYRYYSPDQQQRAIWIRRLRDAGLSLRTISTVLDGDIGTVESPLDAWLADAHRSHASALELVADLKASLRARVESNPVRRTSARFDGAVLGAAIQQVSAASTDDDTGFGGVLLEVGRGGLSVVATDRRLLMARLAVASDVTGADARVAVLPDSVHAWLRVRREVELIVEAPTGRDGTTIMRAELRDEAGDSFQLENRADPFPSVHGLLQEGTDATRITVDRDDVMRVARDSAESVTLSAVDRTAQLRSDAGAAAGASSGPLVPVEFSAALVGRVAHAAVGPWLTCDIHGTGVPAVWRAPSQPDFVALLMPRGA